MKTRFTLLAAFCLVAVSNSSFAQLMWWTQMGNEINGREEYGLSGATIDLNTTGMTLAISERGYKGSEPKGTVSVFDFSIVADSWVQRGSDIEGEHEGDYSGSALSLCNDGNILAIGTKWNSDAGTYAGHVRVYSWNGTAWVQRGQDIDGEAAGDFFGESVELSANGNVLVAGGSNNNDNGYHSGQTRVYEWTGTAWVQRGQDINGEAEGDKSGFSTSINADGDMIAIGAIFNGSGGHVRVFGWDGFSWLQKGDDIDGDFNDLSGYSVSLDRKGKTLAIGSPQNSNVDAYAGKAAVYVWDGNSASWVQQGNAVYGEAGGDWFGVDVSLSADATTLVAGAMNNDGNSGYDSGSARVFRWDGNYWLQQGDDIDGEASGDSSGDDVSINSDGTIVAIGAPYNSDNGLFTGSTRVYTWGSLWFARSADEAGNRAVTAYPNPTQESVQLDFGGPCEHVRIAVADAAGKFIAAQQYATVSTVQLDLPERAGVYFITVSCGNEQLETVLKVTKN